MEEKRSMSEKYSRVYVEITNICNRNCSFCPGTKREKKRLTLDEFIFISKKLRPLTDYLYLHVMGEPLTHPELISMIRSATELGFKVAITTNGTLLPVVGEQLLTSGVYKVNVSLHSFEEGSAEQHLTYINNCIDFAKAASERGILTTLRLWNKGYDAGRNVDTLAIIRKKFPGDWVYGARGARITHKLHLEEGERFDWPDMEAEELGDRVFCHGLGDHFAILSDGRVVPCCLDREGAITLGNVFADDLNSVLNGERASAMCEGFAKKRATEELCRRCGYARRFKL